MGRTAHETMVETWVAAFSAALSRRNIDRVLDLFEPEGFWRDFSTLQLAHLDCRTSSAVGDFQYFRGALANDNAWRHDVAGCDARHNGTVSGARHSHTCDSRVASYWPVNTTHPDPIGKKICIKQSSRLMNRFSFILLGFWQARALAVATELGLADLLAEGPLHVVELAVRTNANASGLFRLLRALESVGIFSQVSAGFFNNSATSECLRKGVAGSQRSLVLSSFSKGNGQFEGWADLEHAVRTGTPSFEKAYGYDFWEFGRRHPEAGALFDDSVRSASEAMTPAVTAAFDWKQFPVIADIGGGIGTQLASILKASPSSKGILFDQPHVAAKSISHDRMEVVSGDFFASVPTGADAYVLRWILHDWSDAKAATILQSLRRSLKPTARLILVEFVVPEGAGFDFSKWSDLQMLVMVGGRERTETEYRSLLLASGFDLCEVVATATSLKLLVARPLLQ